MPYFEMGVKFHYCLFPSRWERRTARCKLFVIDWTSWTQSVLSWVKFRKLSWLREVNIFSLVSRQVVNSKGVTRKQGVCWWDHYRFKVHCRQCCSKEKEKGNCVIITSHDCRIDSKRRGWKVNSLEEFKMFWKMKS